MGENDGRNTEVMLIPSWLHLTVTNLSLRQVVHAVNRYTDNVKQRKVTKLLSGNLLGEGFGSDT